jgi:catechol 2,3-dioxygenase-like lactoylglutathione lyase family enzyme
MRILSIDHVQLAMPPGGEADARRFYVGALGMTETPKPAALAARGGCWFHSGGASIHLGVEADFTPAKKAHPALLVSDLVECRRALEAAGAQVDEDPSPTGNRRFYTLDPFGNRIELIEDD